MTVHRAAYITTSWDDGHPADLRVGELLTKYGVRGTFYVPMNAANETMSNAQIRELSTEFEIGAHTINHVVLPRVTERLAWQEIVGSKSWLEDNTGRECNVFCPPEGRYSNLHLDLIRKAGFIGMRSVELLSVDFPRRENGIMVLPTTVQAYPHSHLTFGKNAIKRLAFRNLSLFITRLRLTDWPDLATSLLGHVLERGGIFHLWGHSWELETSEDWRKLEEVLRFLAEQGSSIASLTNGEVCQRELSRNADVGTLRQAETKSRYPAPSPALSNDGICDPTEWRQQ
jgi:peptidoglycan-N-acetylglucosamine deacetylase